MTPLTGLLIAISTEDVLPRVVLDFVERNRDFFNLFSENSAWHLAFVVVCFMVVFLGKLWYRLREIDRARAGVPLSIGGWGTRGKSGVERKKAALFHALGYEVICKTSGCEAMFIHAMPGQPATELNIFRPYEKATIWEQADLMQLAHRTSAQVFLWECMALNPDYVEILQQEWGRDPITTITNTFPDHEDRQGPAGINIPEVMCHFIPKEGRCFTAEDQHLPILREGARRQGTQLLGVGWRDVDMIPADVLKRYPYEVHPANIALVSRMAEHLEIDRDFVWKEIAESIVPDLGVLKVYGPVPYRGRRLEFSNGMSANERRGFLGCWQRLGFDAVDPTADRDEYVVTVVNNRGDRIARSHVFAGIIARDIKPHLHVCIGTNLSGLSGYVRTALEGRLLGINLFDPDEAAPTAAAVLGRYSEQLRDLMVECPTLADWTAKVETMLAGLGLAADDVRRLVEAPELLAAVEASGRTHPEWDLFRPARAEDPDLDYHLERLRTELVQLLAQSELPDVDVVSADVVAFAARYAAELGAVEAFRRLIEAAVEATRAGDRLAATELNQQFRDLFKAIFMSRLRFVPDADASGDEVCDQIARWAPPGHRVRVMGMQNIKGTGFDFCLRWVSLERVQQLCRQLGDDRSYVRYGALLALAGNEEAGILDAPVALDAVRAVKSDARNQEMRMKAQIEQTIEHLEKRVAVVRGRLGGASKPKENRSALRRAIDAVVFVVLDVIEKGLDAGDAKRRKWRATQILDDLVAERISHARAAIELQALMKRQKGGWLAKSLWKRGGGSKEADGNADDA